MEVAQTLLDHPSNGTSTLDTQDEVLEPSMASPVEYLAKPRDALSQLQAEKRRSSYEKYSAIILPSLKEEATPAPSPAGTLARAQPGDNAIALEEIVALIDERVEADDKQPVVKPITKEKTPLLPQFVADSVTNGSYCLELTSDCSFFKFVTEKYGSSIANINIASLLKSSATLSTPFDEHTISVEVLVITGNAATPLSRNLDTFYDTEILSIIHRTKSKSTGLANTAVWCWLGRKSILGDREGKKLNDLAKRYGTTAVRFFHSF